MPLTSLRITVRFLLKIWRVYFYQFVVTYGVCFCYLQELPCDLQLPQCLLLVVVMDKLPSQPDHVQALWCTESQLADAAAR